MPDSPKVLRSLLEPLTVAGLAESVYGLDVVSCVLVRSFVNDVYEITTPGHSYMLKVYESGRQSASVLTWEYDLVDGLAKAGVPVAPVVRANDGSFVGRMTAPEGERFFGLCGKVDGEDPPFTAALYTEFGGLIAHLHNVAGDVQTTDLPRRAGLDELLAAPLAELLPHLGRDDASVVEDMADRARRELAALSSGMAWGIRHGDATLDNLIVTAKGLVLYDFDLTAAGWIAADLTGALSTTHADAFMAGYRSVREIGDADLAALPWLRVVECVSHLHFHLVRKPAWRGIESVSEGWAGDLLSTLRETASGRSTSH